MKCAIMAFCLAASVTGASAGSATNIRFRVAEWDQNHDGTNDCYTEVVKQGTNFVSSYMRLPHGTEISFWSDNLNVFSMSDANHDGRFDRFIFSSNMIPQQILIRSSDNTLEPVTGLQLKEIQDNTRIFAEGFVGMVDIVRGTNEQEKALLRAVFSNLCERTGQEGFQQDKVGSRGESPR